MGRYIDDDGVENIACAMVDQARKDFIKGGRVLYSVLHRIPTHKELLADPDHHTLSNNADVRWMYDAWRFVHQDPYHFFGDATEDEIINAWMSMAIKEHYKILYLKGGTILFHNHAKKRLHQIPDEEIIKIIDDTSIAADFITAKNYILELDNCEEVAKEWNIAAYERSRHYGRPNRAQNLKKHTKQLSEKKQYNIKRAKEMDAEGAPLRVIAKELGISETTVFKYIRS